MRVVFLKLRANIELDSDISIAEREIKFFCKKYIPVSRKEIEKAKNVFDLSDEHYLSNTRKNDIIGFISFIEQEDVSPMIIKSSFIQEIWIQQLLKAELLLIDKPFCELANDNFYCLIPLFPATEFLTYLKKENIQSQDLQLFSQHLSGKKTNKDIEKVIYKSSTSTPHAHGLHKYKAKFFPRLIRTFLLTESNDTDNFVVLDPFVGSGTTLLESSFLGYQSIGVDIDKLSCLISESKINILNTEPTAIQKENKAYHQKAKEPSCQYKFPSWISKKFDRWENVQERDIYENEISTLTAGLQNLNGGKKLFQTAISDAVTRKFNIRMMGTGVGRFALEIQKTSLDKIVAENIKFLAKASAVINAIKQAYGINLSKSEVINGDATSLNLNENTIDLILTSPPYLPASSGREDYLIGKSISITALNLMTEDEIKHAETASVGSMKNQTIVAEDGLPKEVHDLYTFLKSDTLRSIKADPTYSYYKDIKQSLSESFRVLKHTGRAVYVIGKESVFYTFKTREILFKVECDNIFKKIATDVGFRVKEIVDVELNKKNKTARPRALDKYYESVFILEKP